MNETIVAELRVKSCVVSEFPKKPRSASPAWNQKTEEVWEIKADGTWNPEMPYPISLHFTTPPGHKVLPATIGKIKITIEAA